MLDVQRVRQGGGENHSKIANDDAVMVVTARFQVPTILSCRTGSYFFSATALLDNLSTWRTLDF